MVQELQHYDTFSGDNARLLTPSIVQLLQRVTAGGGIVVSLVQQVVVTGVSGLPQQVLSVSSLTETRITQPLDVNIFNFPLQFLQTSGKVGAEAVLHVVTYLQICCSSLNVIFMGWF